MAIKNIVAVLLLVIIILMSGCIKIEKNEQKEESTTTTITATKIDLCVPYYPGSEAVFPELEPIVLKPGESPELISTFFNIPAEPAKSYEFVSGRMTSDSPEAVINWYKKILSQKGWKFETDDTASIFPFLGGNPPETISVGYSKNGQAFVAIDVTQNTQHPFSEKTGTGIRIFIGAEQSLEKCKIGFISS